MPTDVALSQMTRKTTDPSSTRGLVSCRRLFEGNDIELARKCAYAKTQVQSTEDREQAFYVGSDDWVKVWVNGKEVFSNLQDRYGYPDQNRFLVKLHKGGNEILIRTGHGQGPWRFGLRMDNDPPGAFALETP
ncbi:MAG TPA: hypothetical protein PK360_11085, partial [bacterium]|nr:hypothetical protein [bacterium]